MSTLLLSCSMDAFHEHLSSTVVPVTVPEKPDTLEYANRRAKFERASSTKSPTRNEFLPYFAKIIGIKKDVYG